MDNVHRLRVPPRLRMIDNGSVMSAAELLAWHHDNLPAVRASIDAEADEWEAGRQAAQEAYFARKAAERGEPEDAA